MKCIFMKNNHDRRKRGGKKTRQIFKGKKNSADFIPAAQRDQNAASAVDCLATTTTTSSFIARHLQFLSVLYALPPPSSQFARIELSSGFFLSYHSSFTANCRPSSDRHVESSSSLKSSSVPYLILVSIFSSPVSIPNHILPSYGSLFKAMLQLMSQ